MNRAEELLFSLERRRLKVTLHPQGGIVITPTDQLTDDDRARLRQGTAGLERLLRQRSAITARAANPQLSAEDTHTIAQTLKAFPTSTLLEIRPASRIEPEQTALFASATAVAQPPVIPEPNISTRGTTAVDVLPVVEASPAPAASPPGTEASYVVSAPPLTSATMSSPPPAPAETAPEVMVSEPEMMTEGFTLARLVNSDIR